MRAEYESDGLWQIEFAAAVFASRIQAPILAYLAIALILLVRSVAQPGRALALGARRRRFESCRSDHLFIVDSIGFL